MRLLLVAGFVGEQPAYWFEPHQSILNHYQKFYVDYNEKDRFASVSKSLDQCARSKTDGKLSMSLNALAFPEEFNQVPFKNGQDVKEKCFTEELTDEGRRVRDAFAGLTPVWSDS